jgi:small subunit ribosomal protein S21e
VLGVEEGQPRGVGRVTRGTEGEAEGLGAYTDYMVNSGSPTDRLITAKDHASIQIQIADVDADGKAIKGQATTIAICGRIRAQGDSDDSINRIATKEGREF